MDLDFSIGAMDFGVYDSDFSLEGFDRRESDDGIQDCRYSPPPAYPAKEVAYERAVEFCEQVELVPGKRTFAFVSGRFILGDVLEAFVDLGVTDYRSITIQTLSMSEDNVDSLVNVASMCPGLERVRLVLSDYFYAHERHPGQIVPYIYQELDGGAFELQTAFARLHSKVIAFESTQGNKCVIHGSANLRSNRSIEQVCIECDPGLYDFVESFTDRIMGAYATIDRTKRRPDKVTWDTLKL